MQIHTFLNNFHGFHCTYDNYIFLGGLQFFLNLFFPFLLSCGEFSLYQCLTNLLDSFNRLLDLHRFRVLHSTNKASQTQKAIFHTKKEKLKQAALLTWFLSFSFCSCSSCSRLVLACSSFSWTVVSSCCIFIARFARTFWACSS